MPSARPERQATSLPCFSRSLPHTIAGCEGGLSVGQDERLSLRGNCCQLQAPGHPSPPSIQAPRGPTERRMANKSCPPMCHCLRGGRLGALGCEYRELHWSAHYGSVGTVLQGIQCVAEELIMEGCLRAFAPRGTEPREEIGERRAARLNLIRATCSQKFLLPLLLLIIVILILAGVITAITFISPARQRPEA